MVEKKKPNKHGLELIPPDEDTYTYFENADEHSFRFKSASFQLVNAWWLADASFLAYANPSFARKHLVAAGLPGFAFFSGKSTQCFVASNDHLVIVSFRGTEVLRFEDLLADVRASLVESNQGGKVHEGFRGALDEVWGRAEGLLSHLVALRTENPERTFWFTGHSLGAALATLAADRFGFVQGLYTYGSPRVGDVGFRQDFHLNAYRFVNHHDIIPHLPPALPSTFLSPDVYRHVGAPKIIDAAGEIHDNPKEWANLTDGLRGRLALRFNSLGGLRDGFGNVPLDGLDDHAPVFYCIHIWNSYSRNLMGNAQADGRAG